MPITRLKRFRPIANVSLRWVLVIPFVVQTVGAVTLVGYLSYRSGRQAVTDLSQRLMNEVSDRTTLYLQETLEVPHLINRLNADAIRLGQIPGFETQNSARLEKFFWAQLLQFPSISTIAIANERGGMIGAGRSDQSSVTTVYRTPQFARGTYSISALDAQGNVTQSAIFAENYDARARPWYQTPARARKAVWSPIYQFVSREPSLALSAGLPIYAASGNLQGVLATDVTLDRLNHFLAELKISSSGQVFIVERSGLLVASSTAQPTFTNGQGALKRVAASESQDPTTRETMAALINRFGSLSEIRSPQQFNLNSTQEQGSLQFVRVTPFRDQYGLDWLIVLVVPKSDFMAEIQANTTQTFLLCCLTLAVTTGMGALTASWITKPILKLKQASQSLADGAWQEPLLEDTPIAELQALTHSFNQTADHLRQSFDRIKLALAASEEKFATIFRACPDPIALTTLTEGCVLEANDRLCELHGYSREEMLGRTVVELGFWHNLEDRKQFLERLHQDGQVYNLEAIVCSRDSQIKTVLLSAEVCDIKEQRCVIVLVRDISDRKQVENQLRKSEADLKIAQKIAQCGSWDYDIATKQVSWSEEMYRIHGVEPSQPILIGEDAIAYIHPDDHDKYRREILQRAIAGKSFESDLRILHPDGSIRYVNSRGEPVFDQHSQMIGLRGVVQDVTERKQLERALQASEAKTKSILNSAIAAIASMRVFPDGHWQIDQVSAGGELLSGYTPEELTQDANLWFSRIHPDEREAMAEQVLNDIFAERTGNYEYRFYHKNGSLRWISQRNNSHWNEAQQSWNVTIISVDITDRKLAQIALQASEARLNEAQRVAQVGSWELDVATRSSLWSQELFRIMGLDPALPEPAFDELLEMVVEDDRAMLLAAVERAIAEGILYEIEHRIRRPDGSIRYLVSKGQVVFNSQQQVVKLYGTAVDITDRKRAEIALQQSESRFQKLAAASPAVIYTVVEDVHGLSRFEYLSSAAEDIHEIAIDDLRQDGTLIANQMHPDDRAGYIEAIAQSLETMQPFNYEWRIITPSGKTKWIQANSRPERQDNGEIVWHGIVMDVSDRKQAEVALQASEARFRLAMENAPDVFVIYDRDRRFQYVNQRTIERTGIPRETYIGQRDEDVYPLEIYSQYLPILLKTVETRTFQSGEVNLYPPGQDPYNFFVKYVPVLDEQGEIQQIFGITFDITELKRTEIALRRSESRFQHIAATSPGMLYDYELYADGSGHYHYVSPRCTDILELEPDTLLQDMQLLWQMVLPEDLPALQAASQEATANHSLFFAEFRIMTPSGRLKWIQAASLPGEQLQPSSSTIWSGFMLDVTDRKQMEQELRSAKENAELANRAKSEFLANMSHELRTPLNSVLGFTQLMQRDLTLPPESLEYVHLIHKSGSHLLTLINEILDLSKIEAGKLTLEPQAIDLFELLHVVHSTFHQRATKKGLQLRLEVLPRVPQYIIADPQKLQQILINLVGNAIKFTQQGSVHLTVSLSSAPAGLPATALALQFRVIDTGVGIAPEDLNLIFDAFAQAPAGRQSQEGTGLGLTISRRLVQLMGGEMIVSSNSGQGSTFQFTIPVQLATGTHASIDQRDRPIIGLAPSQTDYRILVVDDQVENRLLLCKILQNVGMKVREATTGEEAIALWHQWQPHLIWLDIRMPGMNGYDVVQHIRAAEQNRETGSQSSPDLNFSTTIIALTAQASPDDRLLALASGCDDYLSKPFQAETLFSKMAEHLGLCYAYADDRTLQPNEQFPLTAQHLAVMPHDWVIALYQTSMTCDQKSVRQLIEQIPSEHSALAIALDQLTENFDFGEMMQLAQAYLSEMGMETETIDYRP